MVQPSQLLAAAREQALALTKIDAGAHTGTKQRARRAALDAMRQGIESELIG